MPQTPWQKSSIVSSQLVPARFTRSSLLSILYIYKTPHTYTHRVAAGRRGTWDDTTDNHLTTRQVRFDSSAPSSRSLPPTPSRSLSLQHRHCTIYTREKREKFRACGGKIVRVVASRVQTRTRCTSHKLFRGTKKRVWERERLYVRQRIDSSIVTGGGLEFLWKLVVGWD